MIYTERNAASTLSRLPPSIFSHPCSLSWAAESQTITAGSPVWLHWESHNLNSMPICSCANTAKQTAGAPASISCLCWPRVSRHPSEVTPALFHKVNLPLKTWYLLTRLIEVDGCMTFIEFFYEPVLVVTPFIQASVRLGCYSS